MQHALSDAAVRRPFDPDVVVETECMITSYQNVYYFADSFVDAKNKLRFVNLSPLHMIAVAAAAGWFVGDNDSSLTTNHSV